MTRVDAWKVASILTLFGCEAHVTGGFPPPRPSPHQAAPVAATPVAATPVSAPESVRRARAEDAAKLARNEDHIRWHSEFGKDSDEKGDFSCADIEALKMKADACPFDEIKAQYLRLIERRTKQTTKRLVAEAISNKYIDASYYEAGDQSDGLHTGEETPEAFTARLKAVNVEQLKCLGRPDAAQTMTELLDASLSKSGKLRGREAACRKNKQCLAHRDDLKAGGQICGLIEQIGLCEEQMRTERANPSGVVNLATLHQAGECLQLSRAELKEAKTQFRTAHKREFPELVCRELAAAE